MATRRNPSGTGLLTSAFRRDLWSRFDKLGQAFADRLGEEDFNSPLKSDAQKLDALRKWLGEKATEILFATTGLGVPWFASYVEKAFTRGLNRSYDDLNSPSLASIDFMLGAKYQFAKNLISRTSSTQRLKLLTAQVKGDIENLSNFVIAQLMDSVSRGLVAGQVVANAPKWGRLSRKTRRRLREIAQRRADRLAQDAMVRAQAEGQLDAYEALGVVKVGVYAEWVTAGDERVCPMCRPLEGVQFTIEEARGLIPRHPGCRCAFSASEVLAGHNRTRALGRRTATSVIAETKPPADKRTKAEKLRWAKRHSVWEGARLARVAVKRLKKGRR